MRQLLCRVLFSLMVGVFAAHAEPLSEDDLKKILAQLEKISGEAGQQLDTRYKSAIDDFTKAMQSDSTALDLYVKCMEKAHFTEKQKSNQDFREWKRNHEEQQKNPHFRHALRHQLNWLCLTLRATIHPDQQDSLRTEVIQALNDLYKNADSLSGQFEMLNRDVDKTIFYTAYGLGEMEESEWPKSPLHLDKVFDKFLMQTPRAKQNIPELKSLWEMRIKMQIGLIMIKENGQKNSGKESSSMQLQFQKEVLPQLTWAKYVDLFKAGDEKSSASAMLTHIRDHLRHVDGKAWTEEFKALISSEK